MIDRETFQAMIAANPAEPGPHLVYADWLEERGEIDEAAKHRAWSLRERIDALVKHADELCVKYFALNGYTHSKPPIHRADYISDKWCRIVTLDDQGGRYEDSSVYCFVCLLDNTTRALGRVKAGDIHKADGWKRAAKHARGSVFAEDFGRALQPHGAAYMR